MGGGPPDFPQGSSCLVVLWILLALLGISSTRLSLSLVMLPIMFNYPSFSLFVVLNSRCISTSGLGSSAFARRYLQNRFFFLLLRVLRCFSSPRLPSYTLFIHVWILGLFLPSRFPHSDSHGSLRICQSPWLIAAYRVLLRLSVPRHSPYALCSLTFFFSFGLLYYLLDSFT